MRARHRRGMQHQTKRLHVSKVQYVRAISHNILLFIFVPTLTLALVTAEHRSLSYKTSINSHKNLTVKISLSLSPFCLPKMSNPLDMTLDEIIRNKKRSPGQNSHFGGSNTGSGGTGPQRRAPPNRDRTGTAPYRPVKQVRHLFSFFFVLISYILVIILFFEILLLVCFSD